MPPNASVKAHWDALLHLVVAGHDEHGTNAPDVDHVGDHDTLPAHDAHDAPGNNRSALPVSKTTEKFCAGVPTSK